jgi:hypothetical protein
LSNYSAVLFDKVHFNEMMKMYELNV